MLRELCAQRGRGGAHRRSRDDERALTAAVAERLGRDSGAATLRELWLEGGFSPGDRQRLGAELDRVFEVEEQLAAQQVSKLEALRAARPERRRKAAEWWLKKSHGKSSRRLESLLCSPVVSDALAAALEREKHPQVREALTGALALLVAGHFPDAAHLPLLRGLSGDRHPGVRFFAVQGLAALLGRGGALEDLQAVLDRLSDGATGVREAAARSLAKALEDRRLGEHATEVEERLRSIEGGGKAPS